MKKKKSTNKRNIYAILFTLVIFSLNLRQVNGQCTVPCPATLGQTIFDNGGIYTLNSFLYNDGTRVGVAFPVTGLTLPATTALLINGGAALGTSLGFLGTNVSNGIMAVETGIGIGVNNPNYLLQMHNTTTSPSGSSYLQFTNTSTGTGSTSGFILGLEQTGTNAILHNYQYGDLVFLSTTSTTRQERMRIMYNNTTDEGWVGIGTVTAAGGVPQDLFHIHSVHDGGDFLMTNSTLNTATDGLKITVNSMPTSTFFQNQVVIHNQNDGPILFKTSNNIIQDRFCITSKCTGTSCSTVNPGITLVGVNTFSPTSTLEIRGSTSATHLPLESSLNVTDDAGKSALFVRDDLIVGIGYDPTITTAPLTSRLTIRANSHSQYSSVLNVTDDVGSSLLFIQDDGKIGVNNSSPSERLDVNGAIHIASATPYSTTYAIYNNSGTLKWNGYSLISTNTLELGTSPYQTLYWNGTKWIKTSNLLNDGNYIGIGTSPSSTYILNVNGDSKINGTLELPNISTTSSSNKLYSKTSPYGVHDIYWDGIKLNLVEVGSTAYSGQTLYWDNIVKQWKANDHLFYDVVNERVGISSSSTTADSKLTVYGDGHGSGVTSAALNILDNSGVSLLRVFDEGNTIISATHNAGIPLTIKQVGYKGINFERVNSSGWSNAADYTSWVGISKPNTNYGGLRFGVSDNTTDDDIDALFLTAHANNTDGKLAIGMGEVEPKAMVHIWQNGNPAIPTNKTTHSLVYSDNNLLVGKYAFGTNTNGAIMTSDDGSGNAGFFFADRSRNTAGTSAGNYYVWYANSGKAHLETPGHSDLIVVDGANDWVGINIASAHPTVGETFRVAGIGLFNSTQIGSDKRFKKNIAKIDNPILKLSKIGGYTFDYRIEEFPDRNFSNKRSGGVLAQEIKEILPEAVMDGSDGYYYVNYDAITPLIIEGINEQQKQIDSVKIALKKSDNNTLKSELEIERTKTEKLNKEVETLKLQVLSLLKETDNKLPNNSTSNAVLFQNKPNPFSQVTKIQYIIPENALNPEINIYNLTGELVKRIALEQKGLSSININGYDLKAGNYIYSLSINGKIIDAKKMEIIGN